MKKLMTIMALLIACYCSAYEVVEELEHKITVAISDEKNDAEQRVSDGKMYLNSSDLEMVEEEEVLNANQLVGLRFTEIEIPVGAKIKSAYIQFTAKESGDKPTLLTIATQTGGAPDKFSTKDNNISSRKLSSEVIGWKVSAWNKTKAAGKAQRTPDLKKIVQEVVNRDDWIPGKPIVFIISGMGKRSAYSAKKGKKYAPVLHVSFTQ